MPLVAALFVPFLVGSLITAGWTVLALFLMSLGFWGFVAGGLIGLIFVLPGLVALIKLLVLMVMGIFFAITGAGQ